MTDGRLATSQMLEFEGGVARFRLAGLPEGEYTAAVYGTNTRFEELRVRLGAGGDEGLELSFEVRE